MSDEELNFGHHIIRVMEREGHFIVRLNSFHEHDGLNIGGGNTREEALLQASETLSEAVSRTLKALEKRNDN